MCTTFSSVGKKCQACTGAKSRLGIPHYGLRKIADPIQKVNLSRRKYENGIYNGSNILTHKIAET